MTRQSKVTQGARKGNGRPSPRLLTVKEAWRLTPNMVRVVFAGPELAGLPENCDGANCKLMIPDVGEAKDSFAARLQAGPSPIKRTYTVRKSDKEAQELTIDFVAHGDDGPASRWASHARPGDFLGFAGPGKPKVTHFEADWDAKGVAIFEITCPEDQQDINTPDGIDVHWLIHPDPHQPSEAQEKLIRSLDWPEGRVQTCIAGESSVIRALRGFLSNEKNVPREDTYISGYWKIGLVEDEHQKAKRAEEL